MIDELPAVSFLTQCQDNIFSSTEGLIDFVSRKETGTYYLRYGFIKKDGSDLSEEGKKIIEYASTPGNLVPLIAGMFERETECHGSWILLQKAFPSPHTPIYQFEAKRESDSSFLYALFLFEIGILEQNPHEWIPTLPHGYYRVPFSPLGKNIITYIIRGFSVSPESKYETISEQSPPSRLTFVDKRTIIIAPELKQIHMGQGDNLQESIKNEVMGEAENE